ncbi:alpha/beta hydrolase [Liquorilactobacillus aquaticus]|nr:alpha/beta hydrolase [Liquorilactobacillus aquaticus]
MKIKLTKKMILSIVIIVVALCIGGYAGFKYLYPRSNNRPKSVPTLYLHGWGASGRSTNSMISYAEKHEHAKKVLTAVVSKKGNVKLFGKWRQREKKPLVQIVFRGNKVNNYETTSKWLKNLVVLLKERFQIKSFNVVAHSMGNLTLVYYELNYGKNKELPQLRKEVDIAGHFNGIIGIDDKANRNKLLKNGKPEFLNKYYRYLLAHRENFPKNQVDVLNIFGNLENGSNSDGDVTRVSARSLKYLLRGRYKTYQEIEIRGPHAQHSKLHENNQVNKIVGDFLWGQEKS